MPDIYEQLMGEWDAVANDRAVAGVDANPDEGWDPAPEVIGDPEPWELEDPPEPSEPVSALGIALKAEFGDMLQANADTWDRVAAGVLDKIMFTTGHLLLPIPVSAVMDETLLGRVNDAFGRRAE